MLAADAAKAAPLKTGVMSEGQPAIETAIEKTFSLLFSPNGRAALGEYWAIWIVCGVIDIGFGLFLILIEAKESVEFVFPVELYFAIHSLIFLIITMASMRRLHDLDLIGWNVLNPINWFRMFLESGSGRENRFGKRKAHS